MVRNAPAAEDSLAAMRERNKFGTAIAAMIKMIATTINNSINEKPFCFFMYLPLQNSLEFSLSNLNSDAKQDFPPSTSHDRRACIRPGWRVLLALLFIPVCYLFSVDY